MNNNKILIVALVAFLCGGGISWYAISQQNTDNPTPAVNGPEVPRLLTNHEPLGSPVPDAGGVSVTKNEEPLAEFVVDGLDWLAKAQTKDGGWGAGSHNRQDLRNPHAVKVDPATTAFTAMAFVRSGNTHKSGMYQEQVANAMEYLLKLVENVPSNSSNITDVTGTQPQSKLGRNIDATFCSQFFTRMLEFAKDDSQLQERLKNGIQVCVSKIEQLQNNDGSFAGGSWAGVLQSSMANSALEQASENGIKVDADKLKKSRDYQAGNMDLATGTAKTESAAGISLYSISSTTRATAKERRKAEAAIEEAKSTGLLNDDAEVNADNLVSAGMDKEEADALAYSWEVNETANKQLQRDDVLSGFGNNGGEEFLSYMMTSESLVISGGDEWEGWNKKMYQRLAKIQNNDGSWSGHHCITSPVFCTAAVVMTLTSDRDADYLATTQK